MGAADGYFAECGIHEMLLKKLYSRISWKPRCFAVNFVIVPQRGLGFCLINTHTGRKGCSNATGLTDKYVQLLPTII